MKLHNVNMVIIHGGNGIVAVTAKRKQKANPWR